MSGLMSFFMSDKPAPPPPPPAPKPPAPLPDENDPRVQEARRRSMYSVMQRGGRSSTILSAPRGGGGDYAKRTLGGEN